MSFYKDYKEWIDQPLHFLMGASLAFFTALALSYVMPIWFAIAVGGVFSHFVWNIRECLQHNQIVLYNHDLAFIDVGVVAGMVGVYFFKLQLLVWFA